MSKKLNFEKGLFVVLGLIISLLAVLSFLPQKSNNRVYGAGDVQYSNFDFIGGDLLLEFCEGVVGSVVSSHYVFTSLDTSYDRSYPYFLSCDIHSNNSVLSSTINLLNYSSNVNKSGSVVFDFSLNGLVDGSSGLINYYRYDLKDYQGLLYFNVDYNISDENSFFVDGVSSFSFVNAILPNNDLSIYDVDSYVPVYDMNSNVIANVPLSDYVRSLTDTTGYFVNWHTVLFRYTYFDDFNNSITFNFSYINHDTPSLYANRSYIFEGGDNYQNGYSAGFDAGKLTGSSDSYNDGFGAGYSVGKHDGYLEGVSADNPYTFNSLFGAVLDAPIQTFTGLLNFELLGVNLFSLFTGLLSLAIIIWILKLAFGGK